MASHHSGDSWLAARWTQRPGPQSPRRSSRAAGNIERLLRSLEPHADLALDYAWSLRMQDAQELRRAVAGLTRQVVQQQRELDALRESQNGRVVVIRELSHDEAKALVLRYYETHASDASYPSDVAFALRLDAATVFDLTEELVREGRLT